MLNWLGGTKADLLLHALQQSLGIAEFSPQGAILSANANFCRLVGYSAEEIRGRHHSLFVAPDVVRSPDYLAFWDRLIQGEHDSREYKRIGRNGRELWIQATYSPVKSSRGVVLSVVLVATDVTEQKRRSSEDENKLSALSRVQAVIEFKPDGEIITANENFSTALGYSLSELRGQHHSMLCDPGYSQSGEYREFWNKLNRGEHIVAEFQRVGKGGRQVWIDASYNPILDRDGQVVKVVKFATDITGRVKAVDEIGTGLSRLNDKDLTGSIAQPFTPAFEKLRLDFNASLATLRTIMHRVSRATSAIGTGSSEIATAADNLARRTEQQAASLEETAAALNAITKAVSHAAEGASHAHDVVLSADADARESSLVVSEAVKAMDVIASSARKISQIIGVIDEIAFQTNLLALNAGVEAARAGDAGRGFTVVASEVRALAQRSAEAAKEIKQLISASTEQVEQGVSLVAKTGAALQRIQVQVADINGAVSEIAGGAKEQARALDEINTAVNQMDQWTQQNAAMVEESTAASHALRQEASQLLDLVDQFRIEEAASDPQRRKPVQVRQSGRPGSAPSPAAKRVVGAASLQPAARLLHLERRPKPSAAPVENGWQEF